MNVCVTVCAEEGFLVGDCFVALVAWASHMGGANSGEEMSIQGAFVSVFGLSVFVSALLSVFFLHRRERRGIRRRESTKLTS